MGEKCHYEKERTHIGHRGGSGSFTFPNVGFEMSPNRQGRTEQGVEYEPGEAVCYLGNLVSFFLLPR